MDEVLSVNLLEPTADVSTNRSCDLFFEDLWLVDIWEWATLRFFTWRGLRFMGHGRLSAIKFETLLILILAALDE